MTFKKGSVTVTNYTDTCKQSNSISQGNWLKFKCYMNWT